MRGYRLILFMLTLLASVGMKGQYNPTNPPEPGVNHTLTLQAIPAEGGSFNIGSKSSHSPGTKVSLRAYNKSNFRFVAWEEDGYVVSTSASFAYTMPARDAWLVARYVYDPQSPAEPPEPDMPEYSTLRLSASPSDGGSLNIGNGARFEVGTTINLQAYAKSDFKFDHWTENGEVISTSSSFRYVMKAGDPNLVAHFTYSPDNPGEPSEPQLMHRLHLVADPHGSGYFNLSSGNGFRAGANISLRAYANDWYTFVCWTADGDTISTNSSLNFVMPDSEATLIAHYRYDYNPDNPGEPGQSGGSVNIYGMTENAFRGQTVAYPVYLENPTPVTGMSVDMTFPRGFTVNTADVRLSGRASGHDVKATALADGSYRIELTGTTEFSGTNGKVFDVMVSIPDTATTNRNHAVKLTHGVVNNADGTIEAVAVRSGYIYVSQLSEDGLYARFSYDKLLGRVQFMNQSSDKAVRYEWDFGDGTTSSAANPMHTYAADGYYDVSLTAYGEYGQDVARATILINDRQHWTIGGTFILSKTATGVRHFASADSLLAFVGLAPVTESLTVQVDADSTFTLGITDANLGLLAQVVSQLESRALTLHLTAAAGTSAPGLALGREGDELTPELIDLYNSIGRLATCDGVATTLCGVAYCPSAISGMASQTVKSGHGTQELDFSRISPELTFEWKLTTTPIPETLTGYATDGSGNLPTMFIDNTAEADAVLTYSVSGSMGELQFCQFTSTITVEPGSATLDESEWLTLCRLREALVAGGWPTPWDMSGGIDSVATLAGVDVSRGHIVGIDLSGQGLTGRFPADALALPRLETLSLADNALEGDVAKDMVQAMTTIAAEQPGFRSALHTIDMSGNAFTGNIGLLSALSAVMPNLAELLASSNNLSDVNPPLPATITTLDLTRQHSGTTVTIDMSAPDFDAVAAQMPSLMLYDHRSQGQKDVAVVRLENRRPGDGSGSDAGYWGIDIDLTTGRAHLSATGRDDYRGANGDILYVSYPAAAPEVQLSSCLTAFTFEEGDADFIDGVTATDLQATILYAFDDYSGRPFNFTAANTFADETINVQDVVRTVDILLANQQPAATEARRAPAAATTAGDRPQARIFVHDGLVVLQSPVPIAAMAVRAEGNVSWALPGHGMEQAVDGSNLVGYSLNGTTLPQGTTVIGTYTGKVDVRSATLSDERAYAVDATVCHGQPTAVGHPGADDGMEAVFDMSGRRLDTMRKGVNILMKGKSAKKVIGK